MADHKASSKETMINNLEQLTPGDEVSYRLPEGHGSQVAIVEFNTSYPWKGEKYILSTQEVTEGKAAGDKSRVMETNEPKAIAEWLSKRKCKLINQDRG
ncbi:MAG: hypothetical protein V1691_04305 [Chloroflexota bacterium]